MCYPPGVSPIRTEPDLARIQGALSSTRHQWEYHSEKCPPSVVAALIQELPHIDPASWPARFEFGGVYLNGRPVYSDRQLFPPARIEYFEPRFPMSEAERVFSEFSHDNIIFDDGDLMVVFKPAGLSAMPAREQRIFNLRAILQRYTGVPVHLPSRLDAPTQGLVLVSRSPRMHNRLQRLFERRAMRKFYLLEVAPTPPWDSLRVENRIGRNAAHAVLRQVVEDEGKEAITLFRRLGPATLHLTGAGGAYPTALLEAQPLTGRTHQIRVHAAHLGYPIIGDNFYGGLPVAGLRLLSYRYEFLHPLTGTELTIAVPPRLLPAWVNPAAII